MRLTRTDGKRRVRVPFAKYKEAAPAVRGGLGRLLL